MDYLAWQRKAIETDPRFGGSWNEIGEAMLNRGDPRFSIQWFRGAINSENMGRGAWRGPISREPILSLVR